MAQQPISLRALILGPAGSRREPGHRPRPEAIRCKTGRCKTPRRRAGRRRAVPRVSAPRPAVRGSRVRFGVARHESMRPEPGSRRAAPREPVSRRAARRKTSLLEPPRHGVRPSTVVRSGPVLPPTRSLRRSLYRDTSPRTVLLGGAGHRVARRGGDTPRTLRRKRLWRLAAVVDIRTGPAARVPHERS